MSTTEETPFMRQCKALKREAPEGSILLVRLGDFYEAFGEDAMRLSPMFGTTLTCRGGIPMTGCHWLSLDSRIRSRYASGATFAVAETVEGPRTARGLMRREIVRIVKGGEE